MSPLQTLSIYPSPLTLRHYKALCNNKGYYVISVNITSSTQFLREPWFYRLMK